MPLLDAALAFAITMFLLANVVTKIVDFVQRCLLLLPKLLVFGLRELRQKWFDDWVTSPDSWLQRTGVAKFLMKWFGDRATLFNMMLDDFLNKELVNITTREIVVDPNQAWVTCGNALDQCKTAKADGPTRTHLSNGDLIDKLKQTELGKRLLTELGAKAAPVFDEISRRYAIIEKEYSEIFRKRARLIATLVALGLAFALNIDSINVLGSYLNDSSLSRGSSEGRRGSGGL